MIKRNDGFTLLEVLMAAAVLAVGVLGGITIAVSNSKNLNFDRNKITGAEIASNVLEDLINRSGTDSVLTAGTHVAFYDQNEAVTAAPSVYTVTWVVTWYLPTADLMDIKLVVTWVGTTQGINYETYRSLR